MQYKQFKAMTEADLITFFAFHDKACERVESIGGGGISGRAAGCGDPPEQPKKQKSPSHMRRNQYENHNT